MLRSLKGEMEDFNVNPLFKKRTVKTDLYSLKESAVEFQLYRELNDYVQDHIPSSGETRQQTKIKRSLRYDIEGFTENTLKWMVI